MLNKILNIWVKFISFLGKIFSRLNTIKILVIFVVGFVSRVLVNYFWDVNVFVDYLNSISIGYYGFMAIFVVLVNEVFSYIDIKLLPKISMDVFSISSIRRGVSAIITNIGNKGKVPLSGDLGDKVLEKSDKVKVTGVSLMGDDAISSGVSEKGEGKLGVKDKGKLVVKDKFSDSDISSNSRRVPFVLGDECVDDVFEGKNVRSNPRDNHEFKRRKRSSSLYSGNYSIHSEASIDPRIPR
jgi:hypothetical protein